MKADTSLPLVPKVRFAEFKDGPRWDLLPLASASDVNPSNDGLPRSFIYIDLDSVKSSVLIKRKEITRDAAPHRAQRLLSHKDIIYQTVRPYQRNNLFFVINDGYEYVASTGYAQLRAHGCPEFLYQLLHTDWFVNSVLDRCTGSNYPAINPSDLASIPVALPRKPEQQKIADCLGSLDDLVAAEGRKLDALRQHKQGLMQQLFPLPGETRPRLRFPEFEDAPEWESRELGLMTSKIGSGVTPRGGEKNYRSSGRPFVRSQNVGWGEFILDNVVHIDEDTHASFAATEVEEGDVLLNISGASIGRSAVADARISGGNVNQHVCIIRCLSEHIQAWFLSQHLISKHGQNQIDSCQAGGNRQGLNFGQIRSFLIPQPRDVAEQERIADCLRAADIILATQAQRISALKRQKQGSLQQLLPSLVEG